MQRVAKFWHWLSTTPYTRELERQRDELLLKVASLERDNRTLMIQVYPRLGLTPEEVQAEALPAAKPERKPRMR